MKIVGLIPSRLNSSRLPQKPLLEIEGIPLVIHTYRRARLSKKLDDLFICCDDEKILKTAKKFNAKAIMTSTHHANGTERICEAFKKIKNSEKYKFVVDVQGDEPLLSPNHIDKVVNYHEKNLDADIILPNLKVKPTNNTNIIKIVSNKKNEVMYLSRSNIPYEFKEKNSHFKKHLSIISFKPKSLIEYGKHKFGANEKVEDIELLRALEIGLKIKTISLEGDSFSVDVFEDYSKAKAKIKKDKYFKLYK